MLPLTVLDFVLCGSSKTKCLTWSVLMLFLCSSLFFVFYYLFQDIQENLSWSSPFQLHDRPPAYGEGISSFYGDDHSHRLQRESWSGFVWFDWIWHSAIFTICTIRFNEFCKYEVCTQFYSGFFSVYSLCPSFACTVLLWVQLSLHKFLFFGFNPI